MTFSRGARALLLTFTVVALVIVYVPLGPGESRGFFRTIELD